MTDQINQGRAERLIWFHHFHKAGGTSMVKLAEANGEKPYQPNHNGNPVGVDGKPINYSAMSNDDLARFVDQCLADGVTFLASEFHTPDLDYLAAREDVVLVTMVRDALGRYMSNYNFDRYFGFNRAGDLSSYPHNSHRAMCKPNYYCNSLLDRHLDPPPLEDSDAAEASRRLALFDVVIPLGDFSALAVNPAIGWSITEMRANSLKPSWRGAISAWRKPRIALRRLTFEKQEADDAFRQQFAAENASDNALLAPYLRAKKPDGGTGE